MSKIKDNKVKEYTLDKEDLEAIVTLNDLRTTRFNQDGQVIGSFIKLICSTKLGYKPTDNLQFEIDFGSEDKILKVTMVPTVTD